MFLTSINRYSVGFCFFLLFYICFVVSDLYVLCTVGILV